MIQMLSDAFSVSGREDAVRNIILSELNNDLFDVSCDNIGNIIAKCENTEGKPSVLLVAHMDECGLMVTDITDDGYLKFDVIGKIDMSALISKRVKSSDTNGVISIKAVHLSDKDEKEKQISHKDLYIDIGAKSKIDAEKLISKGDYFTFSNKFKPLGDDKIAGKALSRSVSCSVLLDYINNYKGNKNIICLFTVLKEVKGRGLKTALNSLENIKCACVIDSVDTKDTDILIDNGPIAGMMLDMSCASEEITKKLINVSDIIQYEYIKDDNQYGEIYADIPAVFLGFPCENKGTNINVVSLKDVDCLSGLLKTFTEEVAL